MKQMFNWARSIHLRRKFLIGFLSLVLGFGLVLQPGAAYAQSNTITHEDGKPISRHAFERLQTEAGDQVQETSPTILKSGKEFREHLPQTFDQDLRQMKPNYEEGESDQGKAVDQAQERVNQTLKNNRMRR